MSRFERKTTKLLAKARERNIIDLVTEQQLNELVAEEQRHSGALSLAHVLSWIGALTFVFGVILLISANWNDLSSVTKLTAFFVLLIGTHGLGIYARKTLKMEIISDGLHFIGAGLFLGGIALVSQIYQLDGKYSTMFLFWFLGIAPLAWCLRSTSISFLSIFALVIFLHVNQIENVVVSRDFYLPSIFLIDIGIGVTLLTTSAMIRDREPNLAMSFRGSGVILLFCSVYILGFYRHMTDFNATGSSGLVHPFACLLTGVAGLACGYRQILPDNPVMKKKLAILLAGLLAVGMTMLLSALNVIPPGPDLKFFNFGWYRTFHLLEWVLSICAWGLWFGLALWCVFFAANTGRTSYLNVGVMAVALGVITRFFDLMGGLLQTGLAFVIGGFVLLATCFFVERWRRGISNQIRVNDLRSKESQI